MVRKVCSALLMTAIICATSYASAEEDHKFRAGFGMDIGVPSGAAVSFVVHPKVDWASVSLGMTYNALALGGRVSLKLDPIAYLAPRFPIGLILDEQGGITGQGTIPGHSDLPSIGYTYLNLYGGLRFGKPNNFHWLLEAGPTYINATSGNFQATVNNNGGQGVTVGNPSVSGWIAPTFVTGFEVVW